MGQRGKQTCWWGNLRQLHDARNLGVYLVGEQTGFDEADITGAFSYPFITCGVVRLTTNTKASNEKSLKMQKQMGYVYEGRLRRFFGDEDGDDAIILSMLKKSVGGYNMGKKSGPPAPPPPPDYTPQRQAAVENENVRRKGIADAYNRRIDDFNEQISGFGSTLDDYSDTVSSLKLGDDLSGLSDIEKDLKGLDRNFAGVASGDVSFLKSAEERVAENKARFEADKQAYEEKYADQIAAMNQRDTAQYNAYQQRLKERMAADGVDQSDPAAVFSWKKQNNEPIYMLPPGQSIGMPQNVIYSGERARRGYRGLLIRAIRRHRFW